MADEVVQYVFEGDSSRLQKATQDAINSLTLYESTVKNIQGTMNDLMSSINEIADWIKLLVSEMKSLVQMSNTASDAFKDVKNSATQYANAMRSVADAQRRSNASTSEASKNTEDAGNTAKGSSNKWMVLAQALTQIENSFNSVKTPATETSNVIKDIASMANSAATAIKTLFGVDIVGTFEKSATAAMDYIENLNLFNVAMGDSIEYGKSFVSQMQEVYGLDPSNIMTYVGNFNQLASAIEMPAKTASILSTNMMKMSTDIASLFNMDVVDVVENMKSGIIGMTRAVTKYGMDIRTTTLQQTALSLGITENVKNMSEANREGLRYITMMRQASNVSGDWAKTINSPSNQLRILKEQLTQLARAIGNVFLRAITKVLPYVNGFVMALREAVQAIADFFGFANMDFGGTTSTIDDISGSITGIGDEADKTAKKLQKLVAPFDQLNVIQESSSKSSSSSNDSEIMDPAIVAAIEALNVPLENIRMKANEVRDAILGFFNLNGGSLEKILNRIKTTATNIKGIFVALGKRAKEALTFNSNGATILGNIKGLLSDIWDWFDLIIIDTKAWAENLNLTPLATSLANLTGAVRNLAGVIGDKLEGVYRNVMLPLTSWTIEEAVPWIIQKIADALNWFAEHPDIAAILIGIATAFSLISGVVKGVISVISFVGPIMTSLNAICGAFDLTLGGLMATAAPIIGVVLGIIAAIAALVAIIIIVITHLDEIKAWLAEMKGKFENFIESIKSKLSGVWEFFSPLVDTVKKVIDKIKEIVTVIYNNIKIVVNKIAEIAATLKQAFTAIFTYVWGKFKEKILDPLTKFVSNIYQKYIKPIADKIYKYLIKPIFDWFDGVITNVMNLFIWLINNLIGFFEWMMNGVIGIVNGIVGVANKVPGVDISYVSDVTLGRISYMANGGVVSGPTQAVIGEGRFDEAVIPLGNSPQLENMLDRFADKVNERPVNVKVQIGDSQWDAFTYKSAKRGEQQLGKPILGGNVSG